MKYSLAAVSMLPGVTSTAKACKPNETFDASGLFNWWLHEGKADTYFWFKNKKGVWIKLGKTREKGGFRVYQEAKT